MTDIKGLASQLMEALQKLVGESEPTPTVQESKLRLLSEAAVGDGGTVQVRIISAGWGSSGYYSPKTLQAAAPLFGVGVHMYANHPSVEDEWVQPERRIQDLAGVTVTEASWDEATQSLVTTAKVFGDWRPLIEDKAATIGVSIRAMGRSMVGEAEGRSGDLIIEITEVMSIDFVTRAGAGGKVLTESTVTTTTVDSGIMDATKEEDIMSTQVEQLQAELANALSEIEKLRAQSTVASVVAESGLPTPAKRRVNEIASTMSIAPQDAETIAKNLIEAEKRYLAEATVVQDVPTQTVTGFGATSPAQDGVHALYEVYRSTGMSERAARLAAGME